MKELCIKLVTEISLNLLCWARQYAFVGRQQTIRIEFSLAADTKEKVIDSYCLVWSLSRLLCCDGGYNGAITSDRTASRIGKRKTFGDKKLKDVCQLQIFATRRFVTKDMDWYQPASGDSSSWYRMNVSGLAWTMWKDKWENAFHQNRSRNVKTTSMNPFTPLNKVELLFLLASQPIVGLYFAAL